MGEHHMKEEHIKELRCPVRSVVYHISRCAGVMSARARAGPVGAERAASHRKCQKRQRKESSSLANLWENSEINKSTHARLAYSRYR